MIYRNVGLGQYLNHGLNIRPAEPKGGQGWVLRVGGLALELRRTARGSWYLDAYTLGRRYWNLFYFKGRKV